MTDIERHKRICDSLNELYAEKNKKYGNSFAESMEEFGMLPVALRLTEKIKRVKHLVKNQEEDDCGESMEDTLRDIANYAVIALVEMEKKKENSAQIDVGEMIRKIQFEQAEKVKSVQC